VLAIYAFRNHNDICWRDKDGNAAGLLDGPAESAAGDCPGRTVSGVEPGRQGTHFHQINRKTGNRRREQMVDEVTGRPVAAANRYYERGRLKVGPQV